MTSATPAGWFPDPAARHQFRYWDGVRWTEHVSNHGTVSSDPPDPSHGRGDVGRPTAEATRRVYVDAKLRIGFRHKRLLADDHSISWGNISVRYTQIVAMSYWVTKVTAIGAHNFDYRIVLFNGEKMKQERITFTAKSEHTRIAYDAAVDALLRFAGAPILTTTVSQLDSGETVGFGGWTFSNTSAAQGKKSVSWGTPVRYAPITNQPGVYVVVDEGRKARVIGDILFSVGNGALVPTLFEICRSRYGGNA
jgi:Protein of unknown function (DUF2510)